jgi:hypothetical protein
VFRPVLVAAPEAFLVLALSDCHATDYSTKQLLRVLLQVGMAVTNAAVQDCSYPLNRKRSRVRELLWSANGEFDACALFAIPET